MNAPQQDTSGRMLVWDLPTRAMHWLLVMFIGICWWSGVENELQYHTYSGYGALWVVVLRLYWGVFGSSTARFSNFVRGPKSILIYALSLHRRNTPHSFGHNPLGAVRVVLMLGTVLAVAGIGLFAVDVDGLYSGPLSGFVTFRQGRHLAHLHYSAFEFLLCVIALHVAAVAFYHIYKRHNLFWPMIAGRRRSTLTASETLKAVPLWRLLPGVIVAAGVVWLADNLFSYW